MCVREELKADLIRINMLGYCRALGTLGHMTGQESTDKQICMEAAGVIAITATCERMLNSIGKFKLVNTYKFINTAKEE